MRRLCLLTLFGCLSVAALIAHVAGISSLTNVFNVNDDPVAKIGETEYETLADAVDAANASGNCTITLLKDIDFSLSPYADYKWAGSTYNPLTITASGITIDLNRHTISNMGNTAIVFGHLFAKDGRISNATIKNGTLIAGQTNGVTNSYVLGIAGVDGVTIKNVTTTGGINIYTASKNVVIEDCNVNGTKYYTVCAQCGSEVTIKGSTYTKNTDSSVATKAMFWIDKAGSDDDLKTTENPTGAYAASTITLESGDFTVDTTNGGIFYLTSGVKPVVKGGTFNIDPTEYLAEGYGVANNNGNYTVAPYVAQIGETKYTTLQAAIDAASDGQTVTLLRDVDATGAMYSDDSRFNLWVKKGITIDGDNKTLTVKGRGIGVKGVSSNIDVTFKDITVKNVGNDNGRCIDTRGNLGLLTLNNATLTTAESSYTGYLQPLTIGGNQATAANVTITNSNIIVVDNANKGYAITTYNPVNMAISGSTIKGWACLNIKGVDNSAGSKGSVITVANNSTLVSANGTPGDSNAFSLIKIEDDNVNVAISGSTINVNGGDNTQSIVSFQKLDETNSTNCNVLLGENNTVTLEGDYRFASNVESNTIFAITGGTFNVDPVAYCADGYSSIKVGDVWKVGTVTSSEPQAEAGATDTQATYSVTTVVKDENNQTIGSASNQTVSVTTATVASGDIVASDVKLSSLDMNDVVGKVVEAVGASAENISAQLAIAAEEISTGNATITFEVHPEAVVSVDNVIQNTVKLTNDDLAANASFTFYLDVATKFANGKQIKIVHKGDPDEISYATVANGKVPVTVTHFSQFELSEVTPEEGMVAVNLTTGVQYETLQAALDAAATQSKTSGEQVTVGLLKNVTNGSGLALYGTAANGANVKIDFGGFTYTVTTPVGSTGTVNQALHFDSGSNVTLTNGTINMTDDATALAAFEMFMQNYGTLVIDQMTIDGTGIAVATYSDPKYQAYPEWYNTEKPQFNYNTAGSSVIRNSTITMTGALGIDDSAALTIEDDAVINVSAIATKGTDERYASATATVTVENGAQFKLTDATGAAAFETLLNTNGQSLGTPDANGVYSVEATKPFEAYNANNELVGSYATLNEAIEAGGNGCTVKMNQDAYGQQQINSQMTPVTFDLNGHTLYAEQAAGLNFSMGYYWDGDHVFTIKDTPGNGGINITPKYTGNACISDNTGRTIIVEGGTFTSTGKAVYCTASNATFTINGGTFNGDVYVHDTGYGHGSLSITDGNINGTLTAIDNAEIAVSGGTFSEPVPAEYCATGYIPTAQDPETGKYSVKQGAYVAQITVGETTTKYETLAEAITASATGDEIVMIANSEENVLYDVTSSNLKNKTVTISGAYTLTSTSGNFGFYFGDYDSGNRPTTDKLNISDITMVKTGGNYTTLFDGVTADLTNVTINGNGNTALSYANGAVGTLTNVTVTNTGNHSQTWRNTALALQSIGTGPSVVTVKSGSYTSANGYAVYMFSSGGTLNIKGGTFSGALIAQIDNNTYPGNQAIINISGGTFTNCTLTESGGENAQINVSGGYFSVDPTAYLLPGYSVETLTSSATGDDLAAFNAGAIYKVQLSVTADITLDDGEEYPYTNDVTITNSITYTRSFTEERIGKYQPWFVPFDYTIKAADLEQFDFYKINVISNSREVGETESSSDEVWVHIYPLTAGTVLHANKPYIIKAKEGAYVADTPYEFVSQKTGDADLILKGKAMDYVHHLSSGIGDFRFYGTYKGTSYSDINATTGQDYFWYLDKLGQLANGNAAFTYSLPSYRWYFIRIAETNYAPMFGFIVDGSEATGLNGIEFASDEDIEGCYTLNGVKVKTPGKGVYIVRYKNGITKKINIK